MLGIGAIIDNKYKILSVIGHGGMSNVYLAVNTNVGKLWAIKEIRNDKNIDYAYMKRSIEMEIEVLRKIKHPRLPGIVDMLEYDGRILIVMDYVEGITLEKVVNEVGPQKEDDVVRWAIQLCDVLEYLHNCKPPIIYRDMKPSNIMLKYDGNIELIDFGTAREFKNNRIEDTICLGTRGYAAPEQFGDMGQTDARTDIYCLGMTMYHLLTGHNPSSAPYKIYPIRYWNSELSTELERIIIKCVQPNPEQRYQTVSKLCEELRRYKDFESSVIGRCKRSVITFVTSCALAVGFTVAGIMSLLNVHQMKNERYEYWMEQAKEASDESNKAEAYLNAIRIYPKRTEAYEEFKEYYEQQESILKEESGKSKGDKYDIRTNDI